MIDDDEVAVALELVGKRDRSLVDAPDRLSFGTPISMPFRTMAVPKRLLGWRPKGRSTRPARRPGQVALERPQGQAPAVPPGRRRQSGDIDACSFCLGVLELAGQLRVQVAAGVDRVDQRRPRRDGPVGGGARACGLGLERRRARSARSCSVLRSRASASSVA